MTFPADPNTLPAKSLHQPYASLVAAGLKTLETRKTRIHYRGPLVICSTLKVDNEAMLRIFPYPSRADTTRMIRQRFDCYDRRELGQALCVVDVVGCRPLVPEDEPRSWFYAEGRFAWELANVRRVKSFRVRGSQGFFRVPKAALEFFDA